ncbi:MAG: ATP-dependent DNA helicase RecQ [Candidatus Falkowbacteria bacterium]
MDKFDSQKQQLKELLKIHYGFDVFRPGQERAIDDVLRGKDTIVVMPTGGGKSLIYQLPALVLDGITIVISPLISLMKDQVDSLTRNGIPATFINSSISPEEVRSRLNKLKEGRYKIVYIAPERFYNQDFMENLKEIKVSLFAIDEAHCISSWGHDFRPSYLRLRRAIDLVGRPTIVALTATATPEVRLDIAKQLELKDYDLVITGFARKNLQFGVMHASESNKEELILDILKSADHGSGIIYVGTRNKADSLVEVLNNNDIKAIAYHAGMDNESRDWVQNNFMKGDAQVVVATNAFGLGIDKRDVRFVIHHDMPGTVEAYYQEAGRAGRDGKESFCLLLFSPKDRYLREFFIKGDNPSPNIILEIYDFLCNYKGPKDGDSILITYSDISKNLSENTPDMAIGTALKILEREGYIARPNEKTTNAFLKGLVDMEKMLELIGKRAKTQADVLEKIFGRFKENLYSGWQVNFEDLAEILNVKKDAITRTFKKLVDLGAVEYQPPFKGTEIKVLKFVHPDDVQIDFRALKEKLNRAYEKLDEMEGYAHSLGCRQEYILKYFGDENICRCGKCDVCLRPPQKQAAAKRSFLGDY